MLINRYWLLIVACVVFNPAISARLLFTDANDSSHVPDFELKVLAIDQESGLPLQGVNVKIGKGWGGQWGGEGITDLSGAAMIVGDGEGFYFVKLSGGGIVPESIALEFTEISRTVIVPCTIGTEIEVTAIQEGSLASLYWFKDGKWELYIRAGQRWRAEMKSEKPVHYGPVPPGNYGVLILGEDHGRNSKFFADGWLSSRQIVAQVEPFTIHADSPKRIAVEPSVKGLSKVHSFELTGFDGERNPAKVVWGRAQLPKDSSWKIEGNQLNIVGLPFCGILADIEVEGYGYRRLSLHPFSENEDGHLPEIFVNKCEWKNIEVVGNDDQFVPSLIGYSLENGVGQLGEDRWEFGSGQTQMFLPKDIASFWVFAYPKAGGIPIHSFSIDECEPIEGGWRIRIPVVSNGFENDAVGFTVIESAGWITFVETAKEFTVSYFDKNDRLMLEAKRDPAEMGIRGNSNRVPSEWKEGPGKRLLSATRFNDVLWTGVPIGAEKVRVEVGDGRNLTLPISYLKMGVVNTVFIPRGEL
ncbi:MAG: hypothetical protein HQ519_16930 [Planctomycetes bacterium]|nr:hypothetical protein [Planctomycetota bacterium]